MHELVKEALSYWEDLRGGRDLPLRVDFDPVDIPRLLPHCVFLEVIDGGRDFRYRVIGENVRSVIYGNYTGGTVGELDHVEEDGPLMRSLREAVATGKPVRGPVDYVGPNKNAIKHDEIALPLADARGDVSHLLMLVVLEDRYWETPASAAGSSGAGQTAPDCRSE